MKLKDYSNLKEMLIDFNEYSTDYTKTRCRELEETIKNTLKEIERINKRIEDLNIINEEHQILNGMLRKENKRLNNIINELEDYMIGKDIYKILLYKLRDLKEGDFE